MGEMLRFPIGQCAIADVCKVGTAKFGKTWWCGVVGLFFNALVHLFPSVVILVCLELSWQGVGASVGAGDISRMVVRPS